MMNIAVIEDDNQELENLIVCIKNFFTKKEISFHIDVFTDPDKLLQNINEIDLVFLDIQISKDTNGIDVGIELRKRNIDVKIIFVTNYTEYLIDGYRANASRYFVKPISQSHFDIEISNVVEDYLQRFAGFTDLRICTHKIYFQNILYIEFCNRRTILHLINGNKIKTIYQLKYWIDTVTAFPFAQSYKSIIVNLNQISGFSKNNIILINNESIPLSKHYKKEFENAYYHNIHRRM